MLIGYFSHYFFGISIFVTSVFLVMLVLVQRGRGGGLVGALGGPGGQSALGTKAGDVFTRITIVVAAIWIFLCASAVRVLNPSSNTPLLGLDEYSEVSADRSNAAGASSTTPGTATPSTATPSTATPGAAAPSETTPGTATSGAATPAAGQPASEKPAASEPAAAPSTPAASQPETSQPETSQPAPGQSGSDEARPAAEAKPE